MCLTTDSTFEDFLDVLPTAFEAVSSGQGVLEGRTGPRGSEHFKAKPRFSWRLRGRFKPEVLGNVVVPCVAVLVIGVMRHAYNLAQILRAQATRSQV